MMKVSDLSNNIEEYLETIYKLSQREECVTTSSISKELNIAPASVTQMFRKLNKMGFVYYSPYKGVKLTKKGYRIANKITRKHRLLETFLCNILKLKKERIHQQACEMEHVLSDDAERALCQLLNHPSYCPDENPIPACDLKFKTCEECLKRRYEDVEEIGSRDENLLSLPQLKEKDKGRISFIRGDYRIIRRLMDLGVTIGAVIKILKKTPFNGQVEIEVRGSRIALGKDIAANVFVDRKQENR